jgi:hypothetical protein
MDAHIVSVVALMRFPRLLPRPRMLGAVLAACGGACSGAQQGYYDACDEPVGLALGCDPGEDDPVANAYDACMKLARCGVILAQGEDDDDPSTPEVFDRCVEQIELTYASQGDTVVACIEEASCPDLARITDEAATGEMPNPNDPRIEGILGYCGRLDP